ncbi:sensor histidine kinase [Treponema denticola]|jgi:sensor histidine kinase/response regulator|uniref:sensor histidine kinase n=1 Tax=Treponema denticola TaxID=158 RepID=UPI0002B4DD2C|nr:response regulator [Treponema denticola]EMB45348.1 hypothetical protein HMPREF9730_01168 [Treponema denticola AL-2]UTC86064.1 response regulator [Treponema denticola]
MNKVLIVEDDEGIADFLRFELEHEGYGVLHAADGRTALELFESDTPDILLLDIMLPQLNGLEVLRRIRKTSSAPVIMLTARGETFDKVSGLDSGADDYLAKPFEIGASNLDERLPVTDKGDDFDELAKTFNNLLSRLQTDFARERQFTADVSHELKTPLAVILGYANMLRRWGKDDPDRLEHSLSVLIREAHSMQSIIENLLRIARFENGSIKIKAAPLSIPALFERLIDETKTYAPGISFDTHIEVETIHTDAELLHQACTIIISNSVKFAGENAHIILSAEYEDSYIISISDNGPGIEEDALPHIFDRFYRGDAAHVRSAGGAGLGLSIVKSIMQVLGGSVSAENGEEKGAVIIMQLPQNNIYESFP